MGSKVRYTAVGVFVVIFTFGLVATGVWLSEYRTQKTYNSYLVYMNEAVSGLSPNALVKFNGVAVGFVKSIRINRENLQQVRLHLRIESDTPITEETVATLKTQGITGVTYIGLSSDVATGSPLKAKPGQKFPVIKSTPSLLVTLDTTLTKFANNLESVTNKVEQLFDEENLQNIKSTLQNVEKTTQTLSNNNVRIDNTLKNTDKMMKNAANASEKFDSVIEEIEQTAKSIKDISKELKAAGKKATQTLLQAQVLLKSVSLQVLPSSVTLLNKMDTTVSNVNVLTQNLVKNPSQLVRGRVPLRKGPGE